MPLYNLSYPEKNRNINILFRVYGHGKMTLRGDVHVQLDFGLTQMGENVTVTASMEKRSF